MTQRADMVTLLTAEALITIEPWISDFLISKMHQTAYRIEL